MAGKVLLDQTMLCEASRLVQGVPVGEQYLEYLRRLTPHLRADQLTMGLNRWPSTNSERLVHLSTLIDAVVLYDRVFVLQAELPPDAPSLSLRRRLIAEGVVSQLDVSDLAEQVKNEITKYLGGLESGVHRAHDAKTVDDIADSVNSFLSQRLPAKTTVIGGRDNQFRKHNIVDTLSLELEGTLSHWWMQTYHDELQRDPISVIGKNLLENIAYEASGTTINGVSHLRTIVYWRLSDYLGIPFFPSCRRLPQYKALCDQLTRSVPQSIYRAIAEAFGATLDEVLEDVRPAPIRMPPLLLMVLEQIRQGRDPCEAILNTRNEFAALRATMTRLQLELQGLGSITDRIQAKRRLRFVLDDLEKHYKMRDDSAIEEVIAFAPEVLKPLTNPTNPEKYSADLIRKPIKWIREWWIKRPFRLAYKLREMVGGVTAYEALASAALGVTFTETESAEFARHFSEYLALYGGE